jgi:hypothetical protein
MKININKFINNKKGWILIIKRKINFKKNRLPLVEDKKAEKRMVLFITNNSIVRDIKFKVETDENQENILKKIKRKFILELKFTKA